MILVWSLIYHNDKVYKMKKMSNIIVQGSNSGITRIKLNNPSTYNSLSMNMMSELIEGQQLESVMGIFNYSFGTYKIQIRDIADLGTTVGIDEDALSVVAIDPELKITSSPVIISVALHLNGINRSS